MVETGELIATPPQDYDDSYSIQFARSHDGYIVSNDLFRDSYQEDTAKKGGGGSKSRKDRENLRKWLKSHCISFTFIGDDFMPNPDFYFS